MRVNHVSSYLLNTPINRDLPQSCGETFIHKVSKLCQNQAPKPPKNFKNFNLQIQRTFEEKSFKSSF